MLAGALLSDHGGRNGIGTALHRTGQSTAANHSVELQGHIALLQFFDNQLATEIELVHDGGKLVQLIQVVHDVGDKQGLQVVEDGNLR